MDTPDDSQQNPPPAARAQRAPRAVPARRATAWFAEAMRLWKRGPATFAAIAFVVLIVSIVFEPFRWVGLFAATIVAPLLATGLLYASLAADRGDRPRIRQLLAILAAPRSAQIAVIIAGLGVFAAESIVAWSLAEVNLMMPTNDLSRLSGGVLVAIYAAGVAVSLPLTFVPFAALFDGDPPLRAFALSWRAFALNVPALALFALITFALLMAGLATMGAGLVLALPWMAAASYAAWKDIFSVVGGGSRDG